MSAIIMFFCDFCLKYCIVDETFDEQKIIYFCSVCGKEIKRGSF